jgi:outer membrane protein assembly factor BamB
MDIDDDNTPEMVFGDDGQGEKGSCVYAYNADTGKRDWRYCIGISEGYPGRLANTAIADINLDGTQDVIFTDYKHNDPEWQGKLFGVDRL